MVDVAVLDNIFTPFFTTKTAAHNVGLGLDLVKRIVDHHEGTSRPERTEFTVVLPPVAPPPLPVSAPCAP